MIAETLFILFNILNNIEVNLTENQNDNKIAIYNHVFKLLSETFGNLSKRDHEKNLKAVFEASTKSSKILEKSLNDYALSLKIYTLDN